MAVQELEVKKQEEETFEINHPVLKLSNVLNYS